MYAGMRFGIRAVLRNGTTIEFGWSDSEDVVRILFGKFRSALLESDDRRLGRPIWHPDSIDVFLDLSEIAGASIVSRVY
ncbi:MAG: hypothetical protein C4523_02410 [Myxococcales bacterium]|nr:MAG: hypothetical protein C4523_02410 [Myxococcales bacterium]